MSTTINSKAANTKSVTAMMDTVNTKTASYYEKKCGYGSSNYYGDGYSYNYNAYPTTKKTHGFEAVLSEDFKNILKMEQPKLKTFLYNLLKEKGYAPQFRDGFIYAKGELPVMLVAHMDTVHKSAVKEIYVSDCGNITSPQGIGGDDRCGIYMITQLMQHKPHILFTEDEEVGGVGAKKFAEAYKKKEIETIDVKYLIELDRKGCNDMVFYDCDNPDFEKYIGKFGWDNRYGTYSDICSIAPVIGAAAVNLSSGYYKAHTTDEIINIDDVMTNIKRVRKMIKNSKNEDVPAFEYRETVYNFSYNYGKNSSSNSSFATSKSPKPTVMDGAAITPITKTENKIEDKKEDKKDDKKNDITVSAAHPAELPTTKPIQERPVSFTEYCVTNHLDFYTDEGYEKSRMEYQEYLLNFKSKSTLKSAIETITETAEKKESVIDSTNNHISAISELAKSITAKVTSMFKRKEA